MLLIEGGRHPVVERARREPFIPNDVRFDDSRRMLIITGPNMGGKSTYMRQTALIVHARPYRLLRTGAARAPRTHRSHIHPHRRVRRSRGRPLDLHARNDRDGQYPQ